MICTIFQLIQSPDNDLFVPFISANCLSLLELPPEVIKIDSTQISRLVHPDDLDSYKISLLAAVAKCQPWNWEGRIITQSGFIKSLQAAAYPETLPEGSIIWNGWLVDITERQPKDLASQQSLEKFAIAFRSSPDAITISTLQEGSYLEVNNTFLRTIGYNRSEVIGKTSLELNLWVNPQDRVKLQQLLQSQGSVRNFECLFRHQSGEILVALVSAEIIEFDNIKYLLAVTTDITERKRAEAELATLYQQVQLLNVNLEQQVAERTHQLQQKCCEVQELSRRKEVLLHTVSHEMRTSIMGTSMLLNNFMKNPSDNINLPRSFIERMIKANESQLRMIESLISIHPTENPEKFLSAKRIEFKPLIETIIKDLEPHLHKNQATVSNLIGIDLPLVMVDPNQMQQVFENLFTYSFKYNPPGLNFTLNAQVESGMMRCTIEDNGVGMTKLECDRLFDLYIRDPQSRCSTGIGIKLYLCKQIITAHAGEIGAISRPQAGTTIWFTLPLATPSNPITSSKY